MYQLSSFLCKWMYRENAILEDDFETCQYGLLITIANIINFLIMLLVGVLCGTVWEMGMFYMVFISLRLFCGGYHAGSYGKCFLLFGLTCLLGMSGARCFSRYVFGSFCFFLVLAIFFGVCIYKKAPVEHRNRLLSGSQKNCFKRKSLAIYLFWCAAGVLLWYFQLQLFFSSIISAFIMVFIYMCIREGDEGYEKGT